MKSRLYMIIIAFAAIFMLQSCEKSEFLNTKSLSTISPDDIFNDTALARANLLTFYGVVGGLPRVFGRHGGVPLDLNACDFIYAFGFGDALNLMYNDYNAANIDENLNFFWANNYSYIYQVNTFIERIEGSKFNEDTKTSFIAEARALRAVFYFELYRFYGGVPIIKKPFYFTDTSAYKLTRSTRDELAAFIIDELTESAKDLPVTRTGVDLGRMEKGAALGMLARIQIYQASLKNDAFLFEQAALAAKSVMDLNRYSLYPDYDKLFLAKASSSPPNKEFMLYYHYVPETMLGWGRGGGWALLNAPLSMGGWSGARPTLNLVDEFEMIDGKLYTESPLYDDQHPYDNRDPRFYASIYYQGSTFKGKPFENWEGGKDYFSNDCETTGFFVKKGIDETIPSYYAFNGGPMDQYDPYLRYSDVLLMYAEAQNEFTGPDASVYNAVDQVRERAGMPLYPQGLTKDQMSDKIRHERHIEFNMEESFFHDIRRWGIAVEMSNRDIWGQKIIKNTDGSITFDRHMYQKRTFNEKYIFFPIPQSEIDKDANLVQNPGY